MKRVSLFTAFVVVLTICLTGPIAAQEQPGIQLGKFSLLPALSIKETYDDNIFLGNGGTAAGEAEESDWITSIAPRVSLLYPISGRGSASLGYAGNFAYYKDNDNNDWKSHQVFGNIDYNAPGGLILGVTDTYTNSEDPFGSREQYNEGITTKRWNNDLRTRLGYTFAGFRPMAYFNYYKQDYDLFRDRTQDYTVIEGGLGIQMQILPKTWGFVRYIYGTQDYFSSDNESQDADNSYSNVSLGLAWDSGAKFSGELSLGYQWLDYDNDTAPNNQKPYEDNDSWIAGTLVNYQATSTTNLAFILSRAHRTTGSDSREYFEDTQVGLNFQQMLMSKLSLQGGLLYQLNEYNQPPAGSASGAEDREDDNYNANIGLSFKVFRYVSLGLDYVYKKKDSNYDTNDYTDNQVTFTVTGSL